MKYLFRAPLFFFIGLAASLVFPVSGHSFFNIPSNVKEPSSSFVRSQTTEFLTYEELRGLSVNPKPGGLLGRKLKKFWKTPTINNNSYYQGIQPLRPIDEKLGPRLTISTWNIEKSLRIEEAIDLFGSSLKSFDEMLDFDKVEKNSVDYRKVHRQRNRLLQADIIVLQEMEIGVKRSGYRDNAAELADALQMNYAFAPQYLEVDPVILGLESLEYEEGGVDEEALEYFRVDPEKYKGVFGSAVLSKYPIKYVEVKPLKKQPYDWHEGEKKKIGFLEEARRFGAKTAFKNILTREMKVGGRHYFRIDLHVPDLPGQTLTVINIHLEIKCQPKDRDKQMKEILSYIKDIENPVIMIGDFNSAPTDISPTSAWRVVKRTAKNPTTWLGAAISYMSPYGLAINTTRGISNVTKNFNDPFATDVKVVAPNPVKKMFKRIQKFSFTDGQVFDFRGDMERSIGEKDKILANSNQRGFKGFVTTFSVKRALGVVGKYRLDWIFVKAPLSDPEVEGETYRFAPHFGETLEELNTSLKQPISDHHPSLVDLPFNEPKIEKITAQ